MLKCIVEPSKGREISGILPGNKRISAVTELCLNKREILKCMKYGNVYGIRLDGTKVLLTDSESINREIMNKMEERKHDILRSAGITDMEKKSIEKSAQSFKNDRKSNNKKNYSNQNNTKNK